MSKALVKVSLCVGDFAVLGHAEGRRQMQHDMQAAPVSVLALKNKLPGIQNLTSFDVILQQHFALISLQ